MIYCFHENQTNVRFFDQKKNPSWGNMKGKCKIIVPMGNRNNIVGFCVFILSYLSIIVKQIRLYLKDPHKIYKERRITYGGFTYNDQRCY